MTLWTRLGLPALAVGVGFALTSFSVQAADEVFCQRFSRDLAFTTPQDSPDLSAECRNDPRWKISKLPVDPRLNLGKDKNYQWCLKASESEVNQKRYEYNAAVNACNHEYLTITLPSGRVTTPPTADNSPQKMVEVPAQSVLDSIKAENAKNPYGKLFPDTRRALNSGKLDSCTFRSLSVDLDNNPGTQEWVATTDQECLGGGNSSPHVWIVQRNGLDYRVLFEGENNVIRLRSKIHNGYKTLAFTTALTAENSPSDLCGSITAKWQFEDGRYLPAKAKAVVDDDCIGYHLPDNMIGAQTADMSAEAWEKAVLAEDQRRTELAAPVAKRIENFIPGWERSIRSKTSTGSATSRSKPVSAPRAVQPAREKKVLGFDPQDLEQILNGH